MGLFDIIAVLIVLTALFSYFNHQYLQLPPAIGVMLISLVLSLVIILLGKLGLSLGLQNIAREFLDKIQFGQALLQWMLGFLLFAGAMTVDLNELSRQRGVTGALAVLATIASMFIIGGIVWLIMRGVGLELNWLTCLLFGALISPTDPIAVLSLVTRAGAPNSVQTIIAAESLFNDGIGVVLFITLSQLIKNKALVTLGGISWLFLQQTVGGAALGLMCGYFVYLLIKRAHDFQVNVLMTLALTMGSYAMADTLRVSGPIAVVVAGLLIGNHGRVLNLTSDISRDLTQFWSLIDEILNAVLFVMIGLEVLAMPFSLKLLVAVMATIPAVLLARWLTVIATVRPVRLQVEQSRGLEAILVWGGLRGGLAIAMALSLPGGAMRDRIVPITYGVVAFSILVQGTTIRRVVEKAMKTGIGAPNDSAQRIHGQA